jgi:signal transduction histidine kinase
MKRLARIHWSTPPTSHRLGTALLTFSAGTILFFLLSSVVANYREQGIARAAGNIAADALPSIQHLSAARTALRQVTASLDELTAGITSPSPPAEASKELERSRDLLDHEWQAYKALPAYRGEEALQARAASAIDAVNPALDEAVLGTRRQEDEHVRNVRDTMVRPTLERLDASLHALVDLNAVRAAEQSENISALRRQSEFIGISLHVLSAICAAIAGILLVRMVRRYARLMELRVTELEHFAGRVAHDIRSPLNSVALTLELSMRDPHFGEKMRSRLEVAGRTVQRIAQLVDGLLLFAIGGAPPPLEARADVQEVLSGIIEGMLPRAEESNIDLHAEPANGSVGCTPGVLTSILANLVGNAIKYMGDTPVRSVSVRSCEVGSMIRIEVEDTGPGVPFELRQRIFDPYVRASTSNASGVGLGLATVRRLVEAHGGSVGVEGNSAGGSVFWVQLPKAAKVRAPSGEGHSPGALREGYVT